MDHDEIEAEVLKRITPTPERVAEIRGVIKELLDEVNGSIARLSAPASPIIVGSMARDTFLPDPDIDIFVAFPLDTPEKRMEELGLQIGKDVLKEREKRYAEHPYTYGKFKGFEVEIVPCFRIERPEQRRSAVDRTVLHTRYIIGHLKDEQKKDARLLKKFMKGIGVYGAETKIQGFSGYLVELLVLRYGSFREVVRAAAGWKAGFRMHLEGESNKRFEEPLVFIDPVDPERNVASALSAENLAMFIHACREYIDKPRMEFFFPREIKNLSRKEIAELLKKRGTVLLALIFKAPDVVEDVLHPQLRKCAQAIRDACAADQFSVLSSSLDVMDGQAVIVFEFETFSLPAVKKHTGPPIWVKEADNFLKKWNSVETFSKPYIEGENWVVEMFRKYTNARELIEDSLPRLSMGKNVNDAIRGGYSMLAGDEVMRKEYIGLLSRHLQKRFPWEN